MRGGALLILGLGLIVAQAHAADIRVVPAGDEVTAQYFVTATPEGTSSVIVPTGDVAVVQMSPLLNVLISSHVAAAKALGLFKKLDLNDFYHGHMINRGPQSAYDSADAYMADLVAIVYHTQESTWTWEKGDHTIRSFVGWMDGRPIQPALDLVHLDKKESDYYALTGTVYSDQVGRELSLADWRGSYEEPKTPVTLQICQGPQCRRCTISTQFYLRPDGDNLKTFFYCEFQPADGELSHYIRTRPATPGS
jgi:hypothetical protein